MPAVFRFNPDDREVPLPPHMPRHHTVTVPCPQCGGKGGTPAGWKLENGERIEIPAKSCPYCKGKKTVFATTEPR